MASRQQEKERRRAEREAAEAAAARRAATKGRLQLALGGLVAVVAIAVAVVLFGGGGSDSDAKSLDVSAQLPPQRITNLQDAARAASCRVQTFPSEGREHTTAKVVYKTNPPTSGNHNPEWAQDGLYDADNLPPLGKLVHTLEHGRIDIQYRPGTPKATVDKLEALGSEPLQFGTDGYHVLVFQNPTGMKPEVAATAWTHSLTCPKMDAGVYDAVRAFRAEYTDKGPELIP